MGEIIERYRYCTQCNRLRRATTPEELVACILNPAQLIALKAGGHLCVTDPDQMHPIEYYSVQANAGIRVSEGCKALYKRAGFRKVVE
jgi:hypothetical protein